MRVFSLRPGLLSLGWLYLWFASAVVPALATAAPADLLDSPAQGNPQASRAVLLDVTRAGERLVAVGERGLVITSSDNGRVWQQANVPTRVALTRVRFADDQQGWAVGHSGVVLHSADGGAVWTRQFDGLAAARIEVQQAAQGTDERRQRNAQRLLDEGADKPWLDLLFLDAQRGWLAGAYGLLFSTQDGGQTWTSRMGDIDNPGGLHLYAIRQAGEQLYIAGEQGALFKSDPSGHFQRVQTPYPGSFFGLSAGPQGDLLAYGLRGNAWRYSAASDTWQATPLGNEVTLTADLRTREGTVLLADEAGRLSLSRDDGISFKPLAVNAKGYVAGMVQAADGALIAAGARGVQRIDAQELQP